jgi:hypothetical protein
VCVQKVGAVFSDLGVNSAFSIASTALAGVYSVVGTGGVVAHSGIGPHVKQSAATGWIQRSGSLGFAFVRLCSGFANWLLGKSLGYS